MAATKKSSSAAKSAAKSTSTRTTAKKSAAKKAPAKRAPATKSPAKKSPAKKSAAKKAPATKSPAKKAPATKSPAKKSPARKSPAKTMPAKKSAARKSAAASSSNATGATPSLLSNARFERVEIPAPRGHTKDGIAYTKDFDVKFLKEQRDELLARRASELARALRLEDEATSIIEDGEMGDVQFDDEGGEGDTMVVQRDLDRVLSSQARQTILEIDAALARIEQGTYGYSEVSGSPIPRERLEAIPETTVLAAEKVSGVGPR